MVDKVFEVDITKDGNCYPEKVVVTFNKEKVVKKELEKYFKKYSNDKELGENLRKTFND